MKRLMKNSTVRRHTKQVVKFCICGVLGATMEFSTIAILVHQLHIDPTIAFIPSGGLSLVFVFFFNKYITFGTGDTGAAGQTLRFALVYSLAFVINYSIASGVYIVGRHMFSGFQDVSLAMGAKAFAIGVTAFWNYFFSSTFVFTKTPTSPEFAMSAAV